MYSTVILSGGKSNRIMNNVPKQYLLLAGKPIIMHSLERLDNNNLINEIIIVCEDEYRPALNLILKQYNIETSIKYASAGVTRQESAMNGLKKVTNNNVIIHEAARPFVTPENFQELIDIDEPNVLFGYPIAFTVLKGNEYITDLLERSELINIQLPQKFDRETICEAHRKAVEEGRQFTEDASMVFYYTKIKIKVIKGNSYNLKITEPIDLQIGEIIYREYFARRY